MIEKDRNILLEEWRLAAQAWADAEHDASQREEGRSIVLNELVNALLKADGKLAASAAERQARTSDQWKAYLRRMHDARHAANMAKIEMQTKDRLYWHSVNVEANERAEKRMVR